MTNLIHLFVTFLQFTAIRLVAREKTMVNCNYRRPWSIASTEDHGQLQLQKTMVNCNYS